MYNLPLPEIPLADWVDSFVDKITDTFGTFFEGFANVIEVFWDLLVKGLLLPPPIIVIALFALVAFLVSRKIGFTIFTFVGLLFILSLGYWTHTMQTVSLVLCSVLLSLIIGIPVGIWASQNNKVSSVITPILDFMQTMPAFVYLIPSIIFFGIGVVPGIVASVIFAMPPTIRLTNLGIRQVPEDLVEASNAFGSTTSQKLFKVQLPLATPTIMAGINQSIMLSLSMVVIASLVGAPGLGTEVFRAVTRIEVGTGFASGICIVILAIILDRITQNLKPSQKI
ncbi:proline/glycine betaine ABC transporter permease [Bacillus carboniphilus]|uniref:Proline/glycine betaine ABC transporter permease n=1 Tax=Bacillus carboniphilus TaxID=86663 RepID=A0ABN0W7I1_9BACI